MAGMFVATVIGNLGGAPEVKFSEKGGAITKFSLAVNGPKKDAKPVWVRVTVFGKQGEAVSAYLEKGKPVAVSGRVSVEEFVRKDGTQGFSVELVADTVTLLGAKSDAGGQASGGPAPEDAAPKNAGRFSGGPGPEDVPF